jgi:hypothetical protein
MGFDFFYGYNCQRQAHTYYPPFLYRDENREYLNNKNIIQPGTKLDQSADPLDENSYRKFIQKQYAIIGYRIGIRSFHSQISSGQGHTFPVVLNSGRCASTPRRYSPSSFESCCTNRGFFTARSVVSPISSLILNSSFLPVS